MHTCIQAVINCLAEYMHESTCRALVIDKQVLTQKSNCFGVRVFLEIRILTCPKRDDDTNETKI